MNLNNLRCFVNVVEAGSISRAAEENYLSQQALSDQIRRLEKYFGASLLERGRPLRPTAAGRLVYAAARQVLAEMEELERSVARLKEPGQRLVISTGLVWTPPFLPRIIERFREMMPGIEVKIIHPGALHDRMDTPLPDAELIVGNLPFAEEVDTVLLFEDRLCVAASEGYLRNHLGEDWETRLTRMGRKELEDLGLVEEVDRRKELEDRAFSAAGESMDMMVFRCRTGQTAELIPERFAREAFEWDNGVRICPLRQESLTFRVGAGFRRGAQLSEGAVRFMELAQAMMR